MALQPSTGVLPPGAVEVDRRDAVSYQYKQIQEWPHFRDVWPFKIGAPLLATLAGGTALIINRHFRLKLKLRNQGIIASQLSSAVGAIVFATAPHIAVIFYLFMIVKITSVNLALTISISYVMQDLFLNLSPCPLCVETRAAFIQTGGAVLYPCISAPLANFFLATRLGTYRVPYFSEGKEILKLWLKFMKPLREKLVILVAVNILVSGYITYEEAMSMQTIRMKLIKFAQQLREQEERGKLKKLNQ